MSRKTTRCISDQGPLMRAVIYADMIRAGATPEDVLLAHSGLIARGVRNVEDAKAPKNRTPD